MPTTPARYVAAHRSDAIGVTDARFSGPQLSKVG